jgi:hypothetical protein
MPPKEEDLGHKLVLVDKISNDYVKCMKEYLNMDCVYFFTLGHSSPAILRRIGPACEMCGGGILLSLVLPP